jgi:hypothetical protein
MPLIPVNSFDCVILHSRSVPLSFCIEGTVLSSSLCIGISSTSLAQPHFSLAVGWQYVSLKVGWQYVCMKVAQGPNFVPPQA